MTKKTIRSLGIIPPALWSRRKHSYPQNLRSTLKFQQEVNLKPHIAMIDDEADLLSILSYFLKEHFEISEFNSPQQFLSAYPTLRPIDLIVTDLKMPGMTGVELIEKVYNIDSRKIPFIILSGFVDKATALQAIDLGVFKIVEKPVNAETLLATIQELLVFVDLDHTQTEMRQTVRQLQELYQMMRLSLLQYIPADILDRMVVEPQKGDSFEKMNFESLLFKLEDHLNSVLIHEADLRKLTLQKFKKAK